MDNPFDTPPAPAETDNTTTTTKKENNMADTANSKITVTLKGGAGFDAPWIVLYGDTVADLQEQLSDVGLRDLMDLTQKAGQHFASQGKPAPAAGGGAPQGAQEPPAGAPEKPGDGWVYKSGTSKKTGKPWQGWMPPQGSDEKPVFFN